MICYVWSLVTSAAVPMLVKQEARKLTASLLSRLMPDMCFTPGPGEDTTLRSCSLKPLYCSRAPSMLSMRHPAMPLSNAMVAQSVKLWSPCIGRAVGRNVAPQKLSPMNSPAAAVAARPNKLTPPLVPGGTLCTQQLGSACSCDNRCVVHDACLSHE